MTMPAVSTVHYNCVMLQQHILSMRCEHTQSHPQTEDKTLLTDKERC